MQLIGDKLSAARGGRTLFANLSFALSAGEALLVTGPNGAGKTTLLRTIAGFLRPAAGKIALEAGNPDQPLSEQCHYVGHLNAVKAGLTVGENASFWCGYLGGGHGRVEPALAAFGLQPLRDIPAGYLSAGQKRRLGLVRLLLAPRPIWLLDEPTAALDEAAQRALGEAVDAHVGAGGLVAAATHMPLPFARAQVLRLGAPAHAA
jgi:heme exporter protein A